jgi:hypothetical protein
MNRVEVLYNFNGYFENYINEFGEKYKEIFGDDELKEYEKQGITDEKVIYVYKLLGYKSIIKDCDFKLFESIPEELVDYLYTDCYELEVDFQRMYKELCEDIINGKNPVTEEHVKKKKLIDHFVKNGIYRYYDE